MSDQQRKAATVIEVPGLAYFLADAAKADSQAKSAKSDAAPKRAEIAALEQMYGYFAA